MMRRARGIHRRPRWSCRKSTSSGAWLPGVTKGVPVRANINHEALRGHTNTPLASPGARYEALIGQAVGQTGSHGVGVGSVLQPRSVRSVASNMAVTTRCLLSKCPVDLPNMGIAKPPACRLTIAWGKNTTASPKANPFFVPPNDKTSMPASPARAFGATPRLATALAKQPHRHQPAACARSVRARISSGRYTVPNSVGLEMVTTPGVAGAHPRPFSAMNCRSAGINLEGWEEKTVVRHNVIRSGAVDSSSFQWACRWQTTRCQGSVRLAIANVLAAVPWPRRRPRPQAKLTNASVARWVHGSSP